MKSKYRQLTTFIIAGLIVTTGLFASAVSGAGSATFTLTPSTGSYANGSTVSVTIRENSGSELVNGVEADLSFDQAKLQFVSVDGSTSNFDRAWITPTSAGKVLIARTNDAGVISGSKIVAVVNFKALVGTGSTPITFAATSGIVRPSDGANLWNGSTAGANFSFATPAPVPAPTPTPSPSPTPGHATPTPTPANPYAAGYLVAVHVASADGKPAPTAKVSLDGSTVACDTTGVASFIGIAPGSHKLVASIGSASIDMSIIVADSHNFANVQEYTMTVTEARKVAVTKPQSNFLPAAVGISLGGLLLLGAALWLISRATKARLLNTVARPIVQPTTPSTGGSATYTASQVFMPSTEPDPLPKGPTVTTDAPIETPPNPTASS